MRINPFRTALILITITAVMLLLLLPVDRHDWMQQMGLSIRPGDIRDASQNGRLVAGLAAALGGSAALVIGVIARKATGRLLAIGLVIMIATVWFVRFAG